MAAARTVLPDPSRFALTAFLAGRTERMVDEVKALAEAEFVDWPNPGSYQGRWTVFPLRAGDHGLAFTHRLDLERNRARMPYTTALLGSFDRMLAFGLSRMYPGVHVHPHRDLQPPGQLRMHVPMEVDEGCLFRVGTERVVWELGRPLVLDGRVDHEVAILGPGYRTVVLIDFAPSPDEEAHLHEVRVQNGMDPITGEPR